MGRLFSRSLIGWSLFAAAFVVLNSCNNPFSGNLGNQVAVWRPYIQNVLPGNQDFISGDATFTGEARAHRELRRVEVRIGDSADPFLHWTDITAFGGGVFPSARSGGDGVDKDWSFTVNTLDVLGRGALPDGRVQMTFRVFDNIESDPVETTEFLFNVKNGPSVITMSMPDEELIAGSAGPIVLANTANIRGDVMDRRGFAPGYPMMQIWPGDRLDITANPDSFADDPHFGWFSLFLTNTSPNEINDSMAENGNYADRDGLHIDFADFNFRLGDFTIRERADGVRMAVFDGPENNMASGEYLFRIIARDNRAPEGIVTFFPPHNFGNDPDGPNPPDYFRAGNPVRVRFSNNADPPTVEINNWGASVDLAARPHVYVTGIREAMIADDAGTANRNVFRLQVLARHPDGINVNAARLDWNHPATGRRGTFVPEWAFYPPVGNRTAVLFSYTAKSDTRDDAGDLIFTTHPSEYELTLTVHSAIGTSIQRFFSVRMDGVGPDVNIRRNVRGASPLPGDFWRMHGGLVNDTVFTVNGNIQVSVDRSDPSLIMTHGTFANMGAAHPGVANSPMVKWIVQQAPPDFDLESPPGGSVLHDLIRYRENPGRAALDFFYGIEETPHSGWVHLASFQADPTNGTHNFKFATDSFPNGTELWLYVIAMDMVHNLGFTMQRLVVSQEDDRPEIIVPGLFHENASGNPIRGPGDLEVGVSGNDPAGPDRDGNWAADTPRRNVLGRNQGIDIVLRDDDGIRLHADDIRVTITDLSTPGQPSGTLVLSELAETLDGGARQWAGTLTQALMSGAINRGMANPNMAHPADRLYDGMYRLDIRVQDYDGFKVDMGTPKEHGFYYNTVTFWFVVHTAAPRIAVEYPADNSLQGLYAVDIGGTVRTPLANLQRLWITFTPDVITPAPESRSVEITDITANATRDDDGFYTFVWRKPDVVFGNYPEGGEPFPGEDRRFTVTGFDALGFSGVSAHRVQVDTTPPVVSLININQGRPFTTDGDVVVTDVWGNVRFDTNATDNHSMYGVKWWLFPEAAGIPDWETPFPGNPHVTDGYFGGTLARTNPDTGEFEGSGVGVYAVVFDSRHLVDGGAYRLYVIARDSAGNETGKNVAKIYVNQSGDLPELDESILSPVQDVVRRPAADGSLVVRGVARDTDGFDRNSDKLNQNYAGVGYVQIRFYDVAGTPGWGSWRNVSGAINVAGELHFEFDVMSLVPPPENGAIRYQIRISDEIAGKNPQNDMVPPVALDPVASVSRVFPLGGGYFGFILDSTPPVIGFADLVGTPSFQNATDLLGHLAGSVTERNLAQFTVTFDGQSVHLLNVPSPRGETEVYEWDITRTVTGYSLFNMGKAAFHRSYVRQVHTIPAAPGALTPETPIITIGGRDESGADIPGQRIDITVADLSVSLDEIIAINRQLAQNASVFQGSVLFEVVRKHDPLAPGNIFHRFVDAEQGGQSIMFLATDKAGNEPARGSVRFVLDTQGPEVLLYTIGRAITHGEVHPAGSSTGDVFINGNRITANLFPVDWPAGWPRADGAWLYSWSGNAAWLNIIADWPSDFSLLSPATIVSRLRDEINRRPTVVTDVVTGVATIHGKFVDAMGSVWDGSGSGGTAILEYRFNSGGRKDTAAWIPQILVRNDQDEKSAEWMLEIPAPAVRDGENTFDLRFSDQAGNVTEIFGLRFVVDREVPFLVGGDRDIFGNMVWDKNDDADYFLVNHVGGDAGWETAGNWNPLEAHRRVFSARTANHFGRDSVFKLRGRVYDANLRDLTVRISSDGPNPYLVIATAHTEFAEGEAPLDAVSGSGAIQTVPGESGRLNLVRLDDGGWEWTLEILERDVFAMNGMDTGDGTRRHITVTATDLAGRRSPSLAWAFFLDGTPAAISIQTPEVGQYFPPERQTPPPGQNFVATGTTTLTGNVSDDTGIREVAFRVERWDYVDQKWDSVNSNGWSVIGHWNDALAKWVWAANEEWHNDNNTWYNATNPASDSSPFLVNWMVNATTLNAAGYGPVFAEEGRYRIHVRAKDWSLGWNPDDSGNPGHEKRDFFMDYAPPAIRWTDNHRVDFNNANLEFTFTVSDPNTVPSENFVAEIREGGPTGAPVPLFTTAAGSSSRITAAFNGGPYSMDVTIATTAVLGNDGTYTLVLTVPDGAGRRSDEHNHFTFTLDNTAPAPAIVNHPGNDAAMVGRMIIRGTTGETGSGIHKTEFALVPNPMAQNMSDAQIAAAITEIPPGAWMSPTDVDAGILYVTPPGSVPVQLMRMEAGAGFTWTVTIDNTRNITGISDAHNFAPMITQGRPPLNFGDGPISDTAVHLMILAVRATDMSGNAKHVFERYWIYPKGDTPLVQILSPDSVVYDENLLSGRFTISGMARDNERVQNVFFRILDLDDVQGTPLPSPVAVTNLNLPGFVFDDGQWDEIGTQTPREFPGMGNGWYMARGGRLPVADWRVTLNEDGELNPFERGTRRIRIEVVSRDATLVNPAAPQNESSWDALNPSSSEIARVEAFVVDGAPVFGEPQIRAFALNETGTGFLESVDWRPIDRAHIGGTGRATFRFTVSHEAGLRAIQYRETVYTPSATPGALGTFAPGAVTTNLLDESGNGTGVFVGDFPGLDNPVNPTGGGMAVMAVGPVRDGNNFRWTVYVEVNTNILAGGAFANEAINFPLFITAQDPSSPIPIEGSLHARMPVDNIPPLARFDLNTRPAGFASTLGGSANSGENDDIGSVDRVVAWFERMVPETPEADSRVRRGISWNNWGGGRESYELSDSTLPEFLWGETLTGVPRSDDPARYVRLPQLGAATAGTGGNFAIVIDRSDSLGNIGHHGHQVSMSMAHGIPGTLGTTWHFVIDSTLVPSGPTEMHFVVFDLAGNARHFVQNLNVMNDAPIIGNVRIATDLRGAGLGLGPDNLSRRDGILDGIRAYWNAMGIPETETGDSADIRRGISPRITPNTQVTGSPVSGALQFVENITVRNNLLALGVETLQEPNPGLPRTFRLEYVFGTRPVSGTGLGDSTTGIRAGRVYIVDNPGNGIPWQRLGAAHVNVQPGYVFLASSDAGGIEGIDWTASGGAVRELQTAHTLNVPSMGTGGTKRFAEFAYTSGAFTGTGAIGDFNEADDDSGLFVLRVFDGPEPDGFADVTVLRLRVNNGDGTEPFAQLYDLNPHAQAVALGIPGRHPHDPAPPSIGPMAIGSNLGRAGLWRSPHTNMSRPGNIEPRIDTGLTNTQLTSGSAENFRHMDATAFLAVDTVSGRVILRGYAEDDQRIGAIDLVFTDTAFGVTSHTVAVLRSTPPGSPGVPDAGNSAANIPARTGLLQVAGGTPLVTEQTLFFTDSIDLFRHRVEWAFVWDTAEIPSGLVVGDVTVRAIARTVSTGLESERRPLGSPGLPRLDSGDADITDHNVRNPGFPGTLPMYNEVRVNIRPYVTGFRRNVGDGFNDTRFNIRGELVRGTRSLQGRYAFARGETAVVSGFNMRNGSALDGSISATTAGVPGPGFGLTGVRPDRYQLFTVPAGAVTGNGEITLTVDGFPAVNRSVAHVQPWHLENDTSLDGTDLWNNRTAVFIWHSNDTDVTGADQTSFPRARANAPAGNWAPVGTSMSIDPTSGVLHASHNASGRAIGTENNRGWTLRSTNFGGRDFVTTGETGAGATGNAGNTVVGGFIDPIINSSIFVNSEGTPWTTFSIIGRNGASNGWSHLGGVHLSGPGGAQASLTNLTTLAANANLYLVEKTWYNASNQAVFDAANHVAGMANPPTTDQFINPRVITFREYRGGVFHAEHIHVSYFDTKDNSVKYRYNLRGTPGTITAANNQAAALAVPQGWTNLDGGQDLDDYRMLPAVAPFGTGAAAGERIVNTGVNRSFAVGHHNDIAVTGEGHPVVVYFDETSQRLRIAVSGSLTPFRGDDWERFDVGSGAGIGRYASVRIDTRTGQNNRVHIAALDSNSNSLVYITGTIVNDTWIFGAAEVVDYVGNVGRRARISLDATGVPWIAYLDQNFVGGRDGVKVAFRNAAGWEAMHVPAPFRVMDERDFTSASQLGLENFPTARTDHTRTLITPTPATRFWNTAVGFLSTDFFRVAYLVR